MGGRNGVLSSSSLSSSTPRTTTYNDDNALRRQVVRETLREGSFARALGTSRVVKVELQSCDFAVTVFPRGDAGTPCDWCDSPATVGVVDRGHRDYACMAHAREWWT